MHSADRCVYVCDGGGGVFLRSVSPSVIVVEFVLTPETLNAH